VLISPTRGHVDKIPSLLNVSSFAQSSPRHGALIGPGRLGDGQWDIPELRSLLEEVCVVFVQNCVGAFLRVLVNVGPAPHML
jgi:hypothetical protein